MPNPAVVSDVEARWRPLSDQETTNAEARLGDAWRLLKKRVANLDTRVGADVDFAGEVTRVVCDAVLRVLKNPDGLRQESIDDYAYTRDGAVASGELYFTDAELDALAETSRGGAFSFSILPTGYPDATFQ